MKKIIFTKIEKNNLKILTQNTNTNKWFTSILINIISHISNQNKN